MLCLCVFWILPEIPLLDCCALDWPSGFFGARCQVTLLQTPDVPKREGHSDPITSSPNIYLHHGARILPQGFAIISVVTCTHECANLLFRRQTPFCLARKPFPDHVRFESRSCYQIKSPPCIGVSQGFHKGTKTSTTEMARFCLLSFVVGSKA